MFFCFLNDVYIAVIGDIKDSKKIEDRREAQEKLQRILEDINDRYNDDISSKFTITLGDEFQGLLHNGKNIMMIITEIERRMFPLKIRFGIGIGAITTSINREMSIGADGPAYYKARQAIDFLKESEKKNKTDAPDVRLEVENYETSIMINTIFTLLTVIKEAWSDRQREIIWTMLGYQDNQAAVAKRLNISQPAVQKTLSRGSYYAYKEALDTVGKAFEEIRRTNV